MVDTIPKFLNSLDQNLQRRIFSRESRNLGICFVSSKLYKDVGVKEKSHQSKTLGATMAILCKLSLFSESAKYCFRISKI